MSMEKYLAERKEKIGEGDATKQIVANMVNNVTFNLIKEFEKQVQEDGYRMDTADLMRLYQMWSDVNESGSGDGTGVLPGLTGVESEDLSEHIETKKEYDEDGNEINYVSSDDLVNLSQEDIEKMIEGREETLNKKNEGTA